MPSPATTISLPKQTLIRLIIDHSGLHESIGSWAIGYDPAAGGWKPVWQGRYPHPVEGRFELGTGWQSIALPRILGHKREKGRGVTVLRGHIESALAESALSNWLDVQRHSEALDIKLA